MHLHGYKKRGRFDWRGIQSMQVFDAYKYIFQEKLRISTYIVEKQKKNHFFKFFSDKNSFKILIV